MAPHTSQLSQPIVRGGPKKSTTIIRLEKVYWSTDWSKAHKADPVVALA